MIASRAVSAIALSVVAIACSPASARPEQPLVVPLAPEPAAPTESRAAEEPEPEAVPDPVTAKALPEPDASAPAAEPAPAVPRGSAKEHAAALARARTARDAVKKKKPPPTGGRLEKDRALAYANGPLKQWVKDGRALLDEAGKHYAEAGRTAPTIADRMRAAAEWGELQLLFAERFYHAGMAAMPKEFDKQPDLARVYADALYGASESMETAAFAALRSCAGTSSAEPSIAKRCQELLDRPFGVQKGAKLTLDSAHLVLFRANRALRGCYERALADDPDLAGDVVLELGIDRSGRATSITTDASAFPSASAVSCIESAVRALRFPPAAGKPLSVRFPISFRK